MTDTLLPPMMYNKSNNQVMGLGNNSYQNPQFNNQNVLTQVDSKNNSSAESPMIKRKKLLKLLQLEEQISKKCLTKEIINEIVNLYAKCVEYYDSIQDHIKIYFLEKIQITLSSIDSLKVIYSSDENSAQKTQIKQGNQSNTPNNSQKKKKQNLIQKNKMTINKFQTESSLNTDQKSQQYSSSYNEQSSSGMQTKSNKLKNINCPQKIQIDHVKVSDFFSPKAENSKQINQNKNSSSLTKNLVDVNHIQQENIEEQNQKSIQRFLQEQQFNQQLNMQIRIDSPSSLVALNQSLRKSIHSIYSSSTKQSPSLMKNIQDFQTSFSQNNQNSNFKESFLEEDIKPTSRNKLKFTLNPNNFLQCDLNISDLNADFSLTNNSQNSRIDINATNDEKNTYNKSKLIEHGKALFNKTLERQFLLNSVKLNQLDNQNNIQAKTAQTEIQDLTMSNCLQNNQNNKQAQEKRTILGVIKQNENIIQDKNQIKNQHTDVYPQAQDNNQRMKQKDKENEVSVQYKQSKSLVNSNSKINEKQNTLNSINEYSIQQKKIERAKRFSMFITMQNQKKQRVIKQDFNNILNRFEQDAQQKDQIFKSDIDNQMEIIKKRLQDRKSKNIQDKVMKDMQKRQSSIKDLFVNENLERDLRNGLQTTRF